MHYSRIPFFILGMLFLIMAGFLILASIKANSAPSTMIFIQLAMAIMSFCLSYLYPQFKQKDERMRLIRQKGMFASFVAMLIYLIVFNMGIQFDFIILTANEMLHLLSALLISTLFISFVIYSKIY
ncbi:permease [Heyndrickxia oleronia]|uniref:permease n=1 Tax=Heyndrickxia oleronia TaxID=38875 RepID=UPI00217EBA13|nr:permease [Heyndrickxia oleronia]MCI1588990.1 permease [Heyndrickxia oleronia]MCI1611918.1 permease [Heyndrickxia oleronia]MCI1743075.1 permease [Heyndrickxia oleronia]MCI1759569.1 permease [Heyndrickxia oleronia]